METTWINGVRYVADTGWYTFFNVVGILVFALACGAVIFGLITFCTSYYGLHQQTDRIENGIRLLLRRNLKSKRRHT